MVATASTHATGTDSITVTCTTCAFTIYSITNFVAFGQSSTLALLITGSGSDTRSISINSGSLILGTEAMETAGVGCGSFTMGNTPAQTIQQTMPCQTIGGAGSISGINHSTNPTNSGTYTDLVSWTCSNCATGFGIGRFIQELQGSNPASLTTVTSCFGNCGSPAITLANTNSTHSINFNNSLTLFYTFQPNLIGAFFVNASVSVAKTYTNGQVVYVGVYITGTCPSGATPFTANCVGSLISSTNFPNPTKGKLTLNINNGVSLSPGANAAVAVSCLFSPCDLNDTNTQVAIQQTTGVMPTVISQSSQLSASSKIGAWAFVTGNIIINSPTGSPGNFGCPGLDCILTGAVNGFCTQVTAACQTGSSILIIIILTILSMFALLGITSYWFPSLNVSTKGIGEFVVLIFIGWLAMFGSFGLISPWLIILVFFAVTWLFMGKLRGSGPI